MEIHKPHAAKTWKEFFIELGTVVLGILIALSLEQAVENWREHRQYREAREAMRSELGFDIFNMSRRRTELSPCIARRIGEIGALLDQADQGKSFPPPSWIGDATSYRVRFSAEPEIGRSGLFTPDEQQRFGALYAWLHAVDVDQDHERDAWARLRALEGHGRLSPELASKLRLALAEARSEAARIDMLVAFLNSSSKLYDVPLAPRSNILTAPPDARPHCLPMDTPPDEAVRRTLYPVQK
jgi:hypothetical protein